MTNNKTDVRRVLDTVKAEGRTALTAPEGKIVCEAYGITVPKEGVATSAAEAATIAAGIGFPVVLKIVSPEILHKTEAGGVLVGVKSAAEAEEGLRHHHGQRQEVQRRGQPARGPGAADADRRSGSHHRRGDRSRVRQAGRLRPWRRAGRGAQGHHVPSRARDPGGRGVDARRHRRRGDPQRRARRGSGEPRRARRDDPERVAADRRFSRHRGDGLEPGLREQARRDRGRRPDRRQFLAGAGRATARSTRTSSAT